MNQKSKKISFRLTESDYQKLKEKADKCEMTISYYMNKLILTENYYQQFNYILKQICKILNQLKTVSHNELILSEIKEEYQRLYLLMKE